MDIVESGEPIGLRRLLSRPTAEYCAEVKTINEEKENISQTNFSIGKTLVGTKIYLCLIF